MRTRSTALLAGFLAALASAACGRGPDLETRTFELAYLYPPEAAEMVAPYVYTDRPDGPGVISHFPGGITVRETPDNLERIGRELARFDRPKPAVRLHFQIIEADGAEARDPRIADVEGVLRDLFRFDGYRLVAEAQLGAQEGSSSTQAMRHGESDYAIRANVQRVRHSGERGAVELGVALFSHDMGPAIETAMSVPVGQTVVVGSAQPRPDQRALILTVRPEFIDAPAASQTEEREGGPT